LFLRLTQGLPCRVIILLLRQAPGNFTLCSG
jgi:hypothetical protein